MKNVFLKLAKYAAFFFLFLFLAAFAWANWNEPSPGEKATVVNFIPYDMSPVSDQEKIDEVQQTLRQIPGVRVAVYNFQSRIMSIAYEVEEVDQETIEASVLELHDLQLHEKLFKHSGPKCPVGGSMATLARIKRFLCLRD